MRASAGLRALVMTTLVAAGAGPLAAQEVDWFGSMQYARGSYIFQQSTGTVALSTGLGVGIDRIRLSASVPLIYQNSGAISWVAGVPIPTGGEDNGAVARRTPGKKVPMGRGSGSGGLHTGALADQMPIALADGDTVLAPGDYELNVGDPLIFGSIEVLRSDRSIASLEVTGAAKAPLSSVESGVGTGAWDYGAGLSGAVGFGRALFFADATWWWYGDMDVLELKDGMTFGAGVGAALSDRVHGLVSFTGAQSMIDEVDAPAALSASISMRVAERKRLSLGTSVGLTESTSDFAIWAGWSIGLGNASESLAAGRVAP